MTVAENIVLGTEPVKDGVLLDEAAAEQRVAEMAKTFRLRRRPRRARRGHHRRPAAARRDHEGALPERRHPDPRRADRRADAAGGDRSCSRSSARCSARACRSSSSRHKLNEVLEIADRITVLRRGKTIETVPREGATEESLARAMVGRDVLLRVEKAAARAGRRPARGARPPRLATTAASRRCAVSPSRSAPARSSASPASTATGRPS